MTDDPENIVLEHLRHIRAKVDKTDAAVTELKGSVNALRVEVNGLRGDMLRQERALAAVEADVDRIKTRLDLSEAPPPAE